MKKLRLLPSAVLAAKLLLCAVFSGCYTQEKKLSKGDTVYVEYAGEITKATVEENLPNKNMANVKLEHLYTVWLPYSRFK